MKEMNRMMGKWEEQREDVNFEKGLELLSTGLDVIQVRDIIRGAEKCYPITLEDTSYESHENLREFLKNEAISYRGYLDHYVDRWQMYRRMFDELHFHRKFKGIIVGAEKGEEPVGVQNE